MKKKSRRSGLRGNAKQHSMHTFEFGVDHDVQVLPRVGVQVPGDGMQAYGGIIQGEANSGVFQPRQATNRAGGGRGKKKKRQVRN